MTGALVTYRSSGGRSAQWLSLFFSAAIDNHEMIVPCIILQDSQAQIRSERHKYET